MGSQISVRLDEDFYEQITDIAKRLRRKRSDVVRLALEKFVAEIVHLDEAKPYNQVKELIGSVASGIPNLGEAHREFLVKKFKKNV
jgi:metal-responsive CopG/Arc/MetJ family transcriptional regulator